MARMKHDHFSERGDRELDLIAHAEGVQLRMAQGGGGRDALLWGILCATTAIARLLYIETGGEDGPSPQVQDVPAECPQCHAPDTNLAHRRQCRGPVQFDVNGARLVRLPDDVQG